MLEGNLSERLIARYLFMSKTFQLVMVDVKSIIIYINFLTQSFKDTHTVYFSSSFYIINQKPMIPTTDFHCITTWVVHSSW